MPDRDPAAEREITSLQNPRVKALVRLRERRERDERAVFPVEEPLAIGRALDAGWPLVEAYVCPELLEPGGQAVLARLGAALPADAFWTLSAPAMAKASYRERPQGLLVIARQVERRLEDLRPSASALLLVCEGVEKPGNLGALLRCADAAGCEAVLVAAPGTDPYNPNAVRASRGALFTVPVIQDEAERIARRLRELGVRLVAAAPAAARAWTAADLRGPSAIVVGAEDRGLSAALLAAADERVAIPMRGRGDSLNVSVSAALLLYEAVRQRGG